MPVVPPRGHLGDVLFKQGVSHVVFHDFRAKSRLASLVAPAGESKGAVGVVGVEYGGEVWMFASEGYTVHAFEPMPKYLRAMEATMKRKEDAAADRSQRRWDIRLHRIAAGSQRNGTLVLKYQTASAEVPVGRIEDYVDQELDVLSIDTQGSEVDVLRGATRLINEAGVRSLWIEIFSCNKRVLEILHLLDEKYAIFDFVPWGDPRKDGTGLSMKTMNLIRHPSFVAEGAQRPSEFSAYWNWMCEEKRFGFNWLQSDILAVRRDVITPELMTKLSTFSHDLYESSLQEEKANKRKRKSQ